MWFKVDDTLAFHSKVVAAGNAAMGLWVRAGAWSSQMLTDGLVPSHMIEQLGTASQARALVRVGLWEECPAGYIFHEWDERQPTRVEVEASREREREKKRRQRRGPSGAYSPPDVSPGDTPGTPSGRPQGSPTVPTRPDPTRPNNGDVSSSSDGSVRAQLELVPAVDRASWPGDPR